MASQVLTNYTQVTQVRLLISMIQSGGAETKVGPIIPVIIRIISTNICLVSSSTLVSALCPS